MLRVTTGWFDARATLDGTIKTSQLLRATKRNVLASDGNRRLAPFNSHHALDLRVEDLNARRAYNETISDGGKRLASACSSYRTGLRNAGTWQYSGAIRNRGRIAVDQGARFASCLPAWAWRMAPQL
jgi:hypothetical protein